MYTKEEASSIRQSFWIAFGRYMSPVPGCDDEKRNWVNYKTLNSHVKYKMDALAKEAICRIEITGDPAFRYKILSVFINSQFSFSGAQQIEKDAINEFGTNISVISTTLEAVSVFNKESWPEIISFLKENIIAFDIFWTEHFDIIDTFS